MTTPANPLTSTTIQRLAFIRFLHEQGIRQSLEPEPIFGTAILSFQDAAEHFLLLAAEHLKINIPSDMKFLQYWERLQPGLPANQTLPAKQPLGRMNKLRVDLKHHGTIPSASAIAQAKADITTFFTDATPMIFGVEFATVDMSDLVTRPKTVEYLRASQDRADQGNVSAAMAGLRLGFEELINYYSEVREAENSKAPFSFGTTLHAYRDRNSDLRNDSGRALERVTKVAQILQQAMRVLALGIDYTQYAQFDAKAPNVREFVQGPPRFDVDPTLTDEDYRIARLFVIQSALQAARSEAVLELRRNRNARPRIVKIEDMPEEQIWDGPTSWS